MRKLPAVAVTVVALALAGCSSSVSPMAPSAAGMMDGAMMKSPLTCVPPSSLPGSRVTVMLGDMGMGSVSTDDSTDTAPLGVPMVLRPAPTRVPAGMVTLVAENRGWRTHELLVLPLAEGERAGARTPGADGEVDEATSLGEASAACGEGSGEGLTSGTVGWTSLPLKPGRYELLCNMTNHYVDGMWAELDVV